MAIFLILCFFSLFGMQAIWGVAPADNEEGTFFKEYDALRKAFQRYPSERITAVGESLLWEGGGYNDLLGVIAQFDAEGLVKGVDGKYTHVNELKKGIDTYCVSGEEKELEARLLNYFDQEGRSSWFEKNGFFKIYGDRNPYTAIAILSNEKFLPRGITHEDIFKGFGLRSNHSRSTLLGYFTGIPVWMLLKNSYNQYSHRDWARHPDPIFILSLQGSDISYLLKANSGWSPMSMTLPVALLFFKGAPIVISIFYTYKYKTGELNWAEEKNNKPGKFFLLSFYLGSCTLSEIFFAAIGDKSLLHNPTMLAIHLILATSMYFVCSMSHKTFSLLKGKLRRITTNEYYLLSVFLLTGFSITLFLILAAVFSYYSYFFFLYSFRFLFGFDPYLYS